MAASVRATSILAGNNNNFTTQAGDTAIVVGIATSGLTSPVVKWGGSGGVLCPEIASAVSPSGGARAGLYRLNNPAIGVNQLWTDDAGTLNAQCVFFVTGGLWQATTGNSANQSDSNDVLAVTPTSAALDLVFYMGRKNSFSPSWTGATQTDVVSESRGAYEAGGAPSQTATFGAAGSDSAMACIGASLAFRPVGTHAIWFF